MSWKVPSENTIPLIVAVLLMCKLPKRSKGYAGVPVPTPRKLLVLFQKSWLLLPANVLLAPANCRVPGSPKLGDPPPPPVVAVFMNVPSLNTIPLMVAVLPICMLP